MVVMEALEETDPLFVSCCEPSTSTPVVEEVMDPSPESTKPPEPWIFASVQKLRGRENYAVWRFQMKNLLFYEDLWCAIAGYAEGDTTDETIKIRNDAKALSIINLMLGDSCISHTMAAQTALEAWRSLENVYEDQGRYRLLSKLLSVKLEDYFSMENYINEVTMISQQIAQTGNPVDEEILGVVLLNGLPNIDSYKLLIMNLEASGSTITSDLVKRWLMMSHNEESEEELPQLDGDAMEGKNTLTKWLKKTSTIFEDFVTQKLFSSKPKPSLTNRNLKYVCWECGKRGHKKAQCPGANAEGQSDTSKRGFFTKKVIPVVVEFAVFRGVSVVGGAAGKVGGAVFSAAKFFKKK